MALQTEVDDLSKVPEPQRGWYDAADEGKGYKLNLSKVDFAPLTRALESERAEKAALKREREELTKKYEGLGDPDAVRELLQRLDKDEEGRLWKEGKIDQVVEKRTEKARAAAEKEKKELLGQLETERQEKMAWHQRVLDNEIRSAALGVVHKFALSSGDVLRAAREVFKLDGKGNAIAVDDDGKTIMGPKGKPWTLAEWLEERRETHPHWFPNGNTGGGAGGDKGAKGGKDLSHLSPTERMTAARAARG